MRKNFLKKGLIAALIVMGGIGLGQRAEAKSGVVQVKGSDTILNASQAVRAWASS